MFCTNCGFLNEDHANFCRKCGRPMRQIPPASSQPMQQSQQSMQQSQQPMQQPQRPMREQPLQPYQQPPLQQNQPLQQSVPQQPAPQQSAPQQNTFLNTPDFKTSEKKKLNFLPWIIAIVLNLFIAIIVVILFAFAKNASLLDNMDGALNGTLEADSSSSEIIGEIQVDPTAVPTPIPSAVTETMEANLDIWYINYESGDPVIEDSISRFVDDYPGCTVNTTFMDSTEYYPMLNTAIASGDMPDIFITWADHSFYDYILNGQLLDITEYMQQDDYKDKFIDAGISQVTYDDRIYGVPAGSAALYGIFYNKDIFNKFSFEEPTTIEELEQICSTLTANGTTPFELGNSINFFGSMYFSCLAARKNGVDSLQSFYGGNNNAFKDGFLYAGEKIQEWVRNGYFNEGFSSMDDYSAIAEFSSGNGAMYLSGSWNTSSIYSQMPDYSDNLGFFTFPAYSENDDKSDIAIGTASDIFYSISSTCDNPEAAFKAITYLIDDSAIEQRITNDYLPPVKDFVPEDVVKQDIMEVISKADTIQQLYNSYLPANAANVYYNNTNLLFDLSIGPEEFYDLIYSEFPY